MSLKERVAYLKGLAEGLGLETESKEGKLISAIIDVLSDMANEVEELGENALNIGEELDAISDDLADVEEFLFDDDYDDDDDDYDFGDFDIGDEDDEDDDMHSDECDCEFCESGGADYQIDCPNCNASIDISEADLNSGVVICSACGEELELEFDDEDEEEEDEAADVIEVRGDEGP